MTTKVTNGIEIKVITAFEPSYSDAVRSNFYFSYTITITNHNNFLVQLLRRHWLIIDASFHHREVDGAGVVGQQPILEANQSYTYSSACDLRTSIGKMLGVYQFRNLDTHQLFDADIPAFILCYPQINN